MVFATGTCAMLHKTAASAISVQCNICILHCGRCIITYNALVVVYKTATSALIVIMHSLRSAAVQYTNYGTGGAFELPTQSGTLPNMAPSVKGCLLAGKVMC